MDESQAAFASQYPSYGFDIEMMKVRALSRFTCILYLTHPVSPVPEVYGYRRWSRSQKSSLVSKLLRRDQRRQRWKLP